MMDALNCRVANRRQQLFNNAQWNGIDFVEVADDQLSLCVHFFGQVPADVGLENIRIEGGRRIRGIQATNVTLDRSDDPEVDSCLRITLDRSGDFSVYRLCLSEPVRALEHDNKGHGDNATSPTRSRLDPRYACIDFSFKVDCPSEFDCKAVADCPPQQFAAPEINYLAKDYASFRQLMLDRLALTMPEWRERHIPDIGITLVELLAYAADHLSYYQDAVATEAYLDTARLRISVRRHARLVDYQMHEGNNARAWITLDTDSDVAALPADSYFITAFAELTAVSASRIVAESDLRRLPMGRYQIFEPVLPPGTKSIAIYRAHSKIRFYTWGDAECCLPRGATRATLLDEDNVAGQGGGRILDQLKEGDVLIFEEVFGPTTGDKADADPAHRHAVRLTRVERTQDELLQHHVVEIEWSREDALPFPLCLSVRLPAPDCSRRDDVSIARGNVILVDHGQIIHEEIGEVEGSAIADECACEGSVIENHSIAKTFRPALKLAPLTHSEPIQPDAPASSVMRQNPESALPQVWLTGAIGNDTSADAGQSEWSARGDLLTSAARDGDFVAEIDDEGRAHLRFGDGDLGMLPPAGTLFKACYRIGNGSAANVAAESIAYLVLRTGSVSGVKIEPRNPMPASGGTAPQSVAEAKLAIPHAFKKKRQRAIAAEDYAMLAQQSVLIQRAAAQLSWMGSWYEARVAIDPYEADEDDAALLDTIAGDLYRLRRIGHDVAVTSARYVPLEIGLQVCVLPQYLRGHVAAALYAAFSNRRLADGKLGFFHSDRLTFGTSIYASELMAKAQAIEGIESVCLTKLQRFREPANGEMVQGVLKMAAWEIPQLDNDPSFPENGKLIITLQGGR